MSKQLVRRVDFAFAQGSRVGTPKDSAGFQEHLDSALLS